MKFYDLIAPELKKVEQEIEVILQNEKSYMYPIVLEYLKRGGKRLRPALVLLVLGALGSKTELGIKPAAVLEMFHNFTLIHDDIEDDSLVRRGKPTMHITHGIPIAINSGDALYTVVWESLFKLDLDLSVKNSLGLMFSDSFKRLVEGQAMELLWYRDKMVNISEEDYFNMIKGKTGALITTSCELGVILAKKESYRKNFITYGMNIGVAFQIQDDVLNLVGEEEIYKKEIGGDITEGKRTLILAHSLANLDKNESDELKNIILENTRDKAKIQRAINLMDKSDGIDYAKKEADLLIKNAKTSIEGLPQSEYKDALLDLADFILKRAH